VKIVGVDVGAVSSRRRSKTCRPDLEISETMKA
jgi:hypothetical protein